MCSLLLSLKFFDFDKVKKLKMMNCWIIIYFKLKLFMVCFLVDMVLVLIIELIVIVVCVVGVCVCF